LSSVRNKIASKKKILPDGKKAAAVGFGSRIRSSVDALFARKPHHSLTGNNAAPAYQYTIPPPSSSGKQLQHKPTNAALPTILAGEKQQQKPHHHIPVEERVKDASRKVKKEVKKKLAHNREETSAAEAYCNLADKYCSEQSHQ
jgi:hypothetical protein